MHDSVRLDPEILLSAYAQGVFPMADQDGAIRWYTANPRGIIPLDAFHIPGTLRAVVRKGRYEIRINSDFEQTMRGCMQARRDGTWINEELIEAYRQLHDLRFAHSVEAWDNKQLVGGLYGVSLGGAFFGESMFHTARDASKVALVHLVQRLKERGFELLDTQASTQHLRRFGCIEITPDEYERRLSRALRKTCEFD